MRLALENLRHFISPYYVINVLMILGYIPARYHWYQHGLSKYARLDDLDDVYKWESQCSSMVLFILAVKSLRVQLTLDMLLADVFLYIKGGILTVTFMVDPRVCIYCGFIFFLAYLIAPQPYRDFLGQHKTETLDLQSFQNRIIDESSGMSWLVLFFTPGKVGRQVNTVFASLSLSFADAQFHFGRVNVHKCPDLAAYQGIQAQTSFHGSTLVMYREGKAVQQHPTESSADPAVMGADNIVKVFKLDQSDKTQPAVSKRERTKH